MPIPAAALALGAGMLVLREYARRRGAISTGAAPDGCPGDPPWPSHLKVLRQATSDMQQWATSIAFDPKTNFGQLFEKEFDGKPVTARIEHHTWTTHGTDVISGCFKGVTLYEPKATSSAAAGAVNPWAEGTTPTGDCVTAPWRFPPGYCNCVLAGGDPMGCWEASQRTARTPSRASTGCCGGGASHATGFAYGALDPRGIGLPRLGSAYPESPNCDPRIAGWCENGSYATGWDPSNGYDPYGYGYGMQEPVSREEAFAAASQLQSMHPNIRAVVAQAPDGFYVRVITFGGGGGLRGLRGFGGGGGGGLGSLFGERGLRRQPAGRGGSDWGDVIRAIDRLPSQIGRVRVQIDRLVSPDFAVGAEVDIESVAPGQAIGTAFWTNEEFAAAVDRGEDPIGDVMRQAFAESQRTQSNKTEPVPIEQSRGSLSVDYARRAQEKLRDDLLARCKCVRNWIRGIGLGVHQTRCIGSVPQYYLDLLVNGEKMSDEARGMIPPLVGAVPVRIRDIGPGRVPLNTEIVAV